MEMIVCNGIVIKEFDRRKRVIRTKQNCSRCAISARQASDGVHIVVHMGGKSDIFFSSEIEACVNAAENVVEVTISEFRTQLSLSFATLASATMVADTLNTYQLGIQSLNKENLQSNRTAGSNPGQKCTVNKLNSLASSTVFRITSPQKSSGLTPSKKKKKSPSSPYDKPTLSSTDIADLNSTTQQALSYQVSFSTSLDHAAPPELELSPEQSCIVDSCVAGHNVFYTGGAGTGKSHILRHIVNRLTNLYGKEGVFVTATTGLAACAVGGVTVHQFAGIRPGDSLSTPPDSFKQRQNVRRRWMIARVLIVDEVSMMSPQVVESNLHHCLYLLLLIAQLLNVIAQHCRDSTKPMGGLQVIFTGDFFQLPPVETTVASSTFGSKVAPIPEIQRPQLVRASYEKTSVSASCRFCFQTSVWSQLFDREHSFVLEKVFRQQDAAFVALLDAIRWGTTSDAVLRGFSECVHRKLTCDDGILPTQIFTHRRDVDTLNNRELEKLTGESREYTSVDEGDRIFLQMLQNHCPARQQLKLKVGCQVLLVKSIDPAVGLVNGARGVVTAFTRTSKRPVVRFVDGKERPVSMHNFSISMGGKIIAQRSQIPLILAWGVSVHKSQGMSVDRAIIDIRNSFEYGQAYVALSRVRTKEGLSLTHTLLPNHIKSHPDVKEFYLDLTKKSSL